MLPVIKKITCLLLQKKQRERATSVKLNSIYKELTCTLNNIFLYILCV